MYAIDELWEQFTALNNLRQNWSDNEGINNETHKRLDEACQLMYDTLVERFQQTRKFGPCCGCLVDGPDGSYVISEWHCGGVYKDNIINQVCGEFYCKDCGCMIHANEKGENPYDVFRKGNMSQM